MSRDSKVVLEKWWSDNINYPFPNEKQLEELSEVTELEKRKIKAWVDTQRKKMRENKRPQTKYVRYFTTNDTTVLLDYFNTKGDHPGPYELDKIAESIKKDVKKIRAWFAYRRFLTRKA
jgi:hypothetical protein